jgi:hypothetical protein
MWDMRPVRRSFAKWLVPKALNDVARLRALTRFTRAGFRQLEELDDPVAAAWREIERPKSGTLISELIAGSGLKRAAIYNRRRAWLEEFSIDILVPYAIYRDMLFYGPNSVMEVAERGKMVRAVDRRDGDASVRLLRQAAQRFDEARRTVLRPAMAANPRELPVFVPAAGLLYRIPKEPRRRVRRPDASRLFGARKVEEFPIKVALKTSPATREDAPAVWGGNDFDLFGEDRYETAFSSPPRLPALLDPRPSAPKSR